MAMHLLPPVYNQLPFFQANQVLTYGHLNDMANYLYQQERYTRNKTIGTGIVCGLSFSWVPSATKARVIIQEGLGLTSAGYLVVFQQPVLEGAVVPYSHRRNFNRLEDFPPFSTIPNPGNTPVYELITNTEFDEELLVPKSELMHADRTDRVLILLFDPEVLNVAKCIDEGCDDKGMLYRFRVRPLLVPKAIMDVATNLTEAGRGWKATKAVQEEIAYMQLPGLWNGVNLNNINNAATFAGIYSNLISNGLLDDMASKMEKLFAGFPWLFVAANNCLKEEITALNVAGASLQGIFKSKAETFRNAAAKRIHIQYLYDYLRDVTDAYNELAEAVMILAAECGGNEKLHPFHLMLGLPLTNETLACTKEMKFQEPHHRFRHNFIPSPVMDGQWQLTENIILLHKRLAKIITEFGWTSTEGGTKITPSLDFEEALGKRALPAYYDHPAVNPLRGVWDISKTRNHKTAIIKGYRLQNQTQLLAHDLAKNNFYRIEGVTGLPFSEVMKMINDLRKQYMLPIGVMALPINPAGNNIQKCSWPDLQEDYLYYRDRVLGYLKEWQAWAKVMAPAISKALNKKENEVQKIFDTFVEMLLKIRCIEDFPYEEWKRNYVEIWNWLFISYAQAQQEDNNTVGAYHFFNSMLNIFNLILFAPLYKIWFAFQYRKMILQSTGAYSFKNMSDRFMGLEHLAGVRRGHTFLLVYDENNSQVVGDFNMPDLPGCGCDCEAAACNGEQRVIVSPMEKPIIMAVYPFGERFSALKDNQEFLLSKLMAIYQPEKDMYELRLDEMGFYKADTSIAPDIELVDDSGKIPEDLKASWEGEQFVARYQWKQKDGEISGGVRLFNYTLKGNFDNPVKGILILIIAGVLEKAVSENEKENIFETDIATPNRTAFYPYDKTFVGKRNATIEVVQPTKETTIGRDKVRVFTTPAGNEMGIYTDKKGQEYLKMVTVRSTVVEEIPFRLKVGNDTVKSTFTVNISDKKEKLETPDISGLIKDDQGNALRNVRIVTATGKEAITNDKGEYTLKGVTAGEILSVERKDFETRKFQINSNLPNEISMRKETTNFSGALDNITIPDNLKNLTKGLNLDLKTRFKL